MNGMYFDGKTALMKAENVRCNEKKKMASVKVEKGLTLLKLERKLSNWCIFGLHKR